MKWFAPILAYLAVAVGIFQFHSAWGALVGFHLAIIFSLLVAKPKIPLKILFTGNNIQSILVSVLLSGTSGLILFLFWDKFGIVSDISLRVEAMGLNASNWIAFIAYFTLVNPVLEEYFWRGYLGNDTANFYPSDLLYAGFHGLVLVNKVQPAMIVYCLVVLVLAGWFWRQLARADGGLLAPVLGHMVADLTILIAVYMHIQGV
jgi:uncharacterized protein